MHFLIIKLLAEWLSSRLEKYNITFVERDGYFLIHSACAGQAYGYVCDNSFVNVVSLNTGSSLKFDLDDPDCFDGVLRFINALPDVN